MPSIIDSHPQRQKIIDAILSGTPLRDISASVTPYVSAMALHRYRRSQVIPAFQNAAELQKVISGNGLQELNGKLTPQGENAVAVTKAALTAAPLLDRIAKRQQDIDESVLEAKASKDARGVSSLIGTDFKGMELQARLLGLLDDSAKIQHNVQIVVPGSVPVATSPGRYEDIETIDITPSEG